MCLRVLIHVTQTPKRRKSCTHAKKAIDTREEILDLITSTSRSARESELRPRIAKHLIGRVRPLQQPRQFTGSLSPAKADLQPSVSHRRM